MLHKNKIFLKLLGSFYDQTANTDFSGRLDYIYTSILFNRYVDTLHRTLLSLDGRTFPVTPHFGYIKASDIDIPTSTITIIDINKNIVENADFVSFGYLDIEEFYPISNGVVSSEVISLAADHSGDVIPIIYIVDESRLMFSAGTFGFVQNMTDAESNTISSLTVKLISDQISYFPGTIPTTEKLVNILLGAEYSKASEEVIYVSDDLVITDLNSYDLIGINQGNQIVSVGEHILASSLITQVATVRSDIAHIGDIAILDRYLLTVGLSSSNVNYLSKLSSALSKSNIAVDIPIESFTYIDTEAISIVSSVFGVSSTKTLYTTSSHSDSDFMNVEAGSEFLIEKYSDIEVGMLGFWILDTISFESQVEVSEQDYTILSVSEPGYLIDSNQWLMDPVAISDTLAISDSVINLLSEDLDTMIQDEENMDGLHIDTNIGGVDDSLAEMLLDPAIGNVTDEDAYIEDIEVSLSESINMYDSSEYDISASDAAIAILSDAMSSVYENIEITSIVDSLTGHSELFDDSSIHVLDAKAIISTDISTILYEDGPSIDTTIGVKLSEEIEIDEFILNEGVILESTEAFGTLGGSSELILLDIIETVLLTDDSDISSDNSIDS